MFADGGDRGMDFVFRAFLHTHNKGTGPTVRHSAGRSSLANTVQYS